MRNNKQQGKQNQKQVDYTSLIYGKVPPQAKQIEESLLGLILWMNKELDVLLEVKQILRPDDFYVDAHQRIFQAMVEMSARSQAVDVPLVIDHLLRKGELDLVGGPYYVTKLTNTVTNGVGYLQYARIIKQYAIARRLITFSGEVMNKAYDEDPFDSLEFAQQKLYEIFEEIKTSQITDTTVIAVNTIKKTVEVNEEEEPPVYTKIEDWDKINGSLFPGLYVLAARPGMGKTAFLVQLICNMSSDTPVALINGEMTDEQITRRIVCNLVEFDNDRYKVDKTKWPEEWRDHFYKGIQEFVNLKLHIYSDSQKIEDIANMLRFYRKRFGIKAAMVDYLQILGVADRSGSYMTKTDRIDHCLEILRGLTKELGIPIFLLSQLNREVNKRAGSFRPGLSDLKGSGTIEESAFQIGFLHRPEYYQTEGAVDEMGESVKGLCYLFIDKHRDGELKMDGIKFRFRPRLSMFEKWEDEYSNFNPALYIKKGEPSLESGSAYNNEYLNELPDDEEPF